MSVSDWSGDLSTLKRIAFDTNALIYFIERQPDFGPMVREALWMVHRGLATAVVSTMVELELLVKPLREKDSGLVDQVRTFFRHQRNLVIRPMDRPVAQAAARLRAATGLQAPDSIIAATATVEGCDAIIGNDSRFAKRMPSIPYLYLDSYVR